MKNLFFFFAVLSLGCADKVSEPIIETPTPNLTGTWYARSQELSVDFNLLDQGGTITGTCLINQWTTVLDAYRFLGKHASNKIELRFFGFHDHQTGTLQGARLDSSIIRGTINGFGYNNKEIVLVRQ